MKNRPVAILASVAAMAVVLAFSGCGKSDKPDPAKSAEAPSGKASGPEGLKLAPDEAQRAGIQYETVQNKPVPDVISVTATIRVNQDRIARVAPRVEGRIVGVSANLGDQVKAGQPLATLDSLAIGEASVALLQAQSTDRAAEADFKRASALNAEEIIAQKDFLRLKAERERAAVALRAAEDRLKLLGVDPKRLSRVESTFPLTAPLTGTVVQKKATVGELGTPSDPLFTVADLSTVWVEANLTENQLGKVRPGVAAGVVVAAYPDQTFQGKVTYVASLLDKETRTIPARIEVANRDGRLKPEMFAKAIIDTGGDAPTSTAISVPDAAIVLMQGQPTVFLFAKGGYEQRAVELGDKLSGRTVVKSGLVVGEQVLIAGTYALKARVLKSQIGDEH